MWSSERSRHGDGGEGDSDDRHRDSAVNVPLPCHAPVDRSIHEPRSRRVNTWSEAAADLCYKSHMEFRILGTLEVSDGGAPVAVSGPRLRALLAILLTRANQVVSRDRLIDELFGDEPREAARNLVQVYVSRLRKALGERGSIVTRSPGYVLELGPDELDLHVFERLAWEAREALGSGAAEVASERLREALGLWRGPALEEFAYEPFAQNEIARLEELRVAALEDRVEADLALGRLGGLVGELELLVSEYPLRERLRGQLMLALYRSGRQAEALAVYQDTRRALVDGLGIEPGVALQELERLILRHDPALDAAPRVGSADAAMTTVRRSIVLIPLGGASLDDLVALAAPLTRSLPQRELILARLATDASELGTTASELHAWRDDLAARGVAARAAAFTSSAVGDDIARLVTEQDADLLVVSGGEVADTASAPCDVAILAAGTPPETVPVVSVPFGGGEHDWAALELGAWLASVHGAGLRLLGPVGDPVGGKRDASRLLARASLIVQQFADLPAEPVLTPPGEDGVLRATDPDGLLVIGLSSRWRDEGIGAVRAGIARRSQAPVLFVRRGVRPGGLAPAEELTRFTWSLAEA